MPLLANMVALTSEEVHLAARGMSQRCGELRARMEARAQATQRKHMANLHANYTTTGLQKEELKEESPRAIAKYEI